MQQKIYTFLKMTYARKYALEYAHIRGTLHVPRMLPFSRAQNFWKVRGLERPPTAALCPTTEHLCQKHYTLLINVVEYKHRAFMLFLRAFSALISPKNKSGFFILNPWTYGHGHYTLKQSYRVYNISRQLFQQYLLF